MSTLKNKIWKKIQTSPDSVFLRKDFSNMGGYDQIGRALKELADSGCLYRAGYGIFVKTKTTQSGFCTPSIRLSEIGLVALKKLGYKPRLGTIARLHVAGQTTQLPANCVLDVGGTRVRRKIKVGIREINFEHKSRFSP